MAITFPLTHIANIYKKFEKSKLFDRKNAPEGQNLNKLF